MNNRGVLSYLAISICVFVSSAFPGTASEGIEGTYEGDGLPQQANPAWMLVGGTAEESVEEGVWVVRAARDFERSVDFGMSLRMYGDHNDVKVRWATTSRDNYSADGFRIRTQGRVFRFHPVDREDGQDLLLIGTMGGMRPDLKPCILNPKKLPGFEASELNEYRIQWITDRDDTFEFQLYVNDELVGMFPGEPLAEAGPWNLAFEFHSGTQRVDLVQWKVHQGGTPIDEQTRRLTDHAQLLLDDHLVERYQGLTRTIHQPRMHPANPVLKAEKPWEFGAVLLWGNVIFDVQDDIFKMWYMGWGNDEGGAVDGYRTPVCYAMSKDGVHWNRPRLRLVNFRYRNPGDPDGPIREAPVNNVVYNDERSPRGMDSPTVVKDLHAIDPSFRYKMSYWHRLPAGTGIFQSHSSDGIHWTHIPEMVVQSGDRNTFHLDPFRRRWVVVTRPSGSMYELQKFGQYRGNFVRSRIELEPRDREEFPDCRLYSCPVISYEGMLIAFPELYSLKINRWITYLAWSHDGVNWQIDPDRVRWMPWNEQPGTFDCWRRNIHNGGVIRRDDQLWVYFSGRSQGKNVEGRSGYLVPSGTPGFDPRGIMGSVGIGTLRVDGFCSRDAGPDKGSLMTRVFQFQAAGLKINANVRDGGSIRAGLLDTDGNPIEGFATTDCDPITGDNVAHQVTWLGRSDLQELADRPVRLELQLKDAELYSFRFCGEIEDEAGFIPLFNGNDLDGWTVMGDPRGWEVKNGVIRSESRNGGKWIRSKNQYGNFILKLDWRVSVEGNSGVFIRALEGRPPWIDGYEIQISNMNQDPLHCTGALYGCVPVQPRPDETPEVWHTYEVRCQGPHITILTDGVECIDVDQSKIEKLRNRPLHGYIGLQDAHRRFENHFIEYRNIRIQPLSQ